MFDHEILRVKISEVYGTETEFAKRLGKNRATLSKKLNGVNDFTAEEIYKSCNLLGIEPEDVSAYFFVAV